MVVVIGSCTDLLQVPAISNVDKDPQLVLCPALLLSQGAVWIHGEPTCLAAEGKEDPCHWRNSQLMTHVLDDVLYM